VTTPAAATLASPVVTATALNRTSAFLSWSAIAGATAYRIYYKTSTGTPQMLGTVNSSQAMWGKFYITISGLTAGSNVSFMIEAYNSTTISDSAWVSLKLPS
jgi:hypothetical protein